MATNYDRGRAFEYRARDALKDKYGAAAVIRSAGSKGKIDLLALFPILNTLTTDAETGDVWMVQCKRDGKLPAAEREELLRLAELTGAIPYTASPGPRGRGVVFELLTKES